ncbi:glycosyltransferase family 9 protein [bacterium]|nr:glycosyltransferase family 9 protein [bacterium]MBT4291263.1 glycosyltransferase family 9 protein [bacterium]MBT7311507.1 glycosyltransferase family 9 protein [bacterium]
MNRTLVIRFGALGDLCICGWFLSGLKNAHPESEISLLTKQRFSDLAMQFSGVDKIVAPDLSNPLTAANSAEIKSFNKIIDAHSVLRSKQMLLLSGKRADSILKKDTFSRFALIARARFGIRHPDTPVTHLLDRFCKLEQNVKPSAPLAHLDNKSADAPIAIAPGAMWKSKQWPIENFDTVIQHLLHNDKNIRLFLGPQEMQWFSNSSLARITNSKMQIINNQPLTEVARLLGECSQTITNDSGLLHLSEATNTPVIAIFGPTVKQFGYFPLLENSIALTHDITCRPCSRAGRKDCRRQDLACLTEITPASVLTAVGGE